MEVNTQIVSFLMTLLIGLTLGVIFDFYRVMHGVYRMKSVMTFIFDGLYWLLAIVITFACLLFSNWAELRFYVFIGMIGGALFYYKFLSRYIVFIFIRSVRVIFTTIAWLKKSIKVCILHPVGYILGIFLFPFRFTARKSRMFSMKLRNYRIFRKKIQKEEDSGPKD